MLIFITRNNLKMKRFHSLNGDVQRNLPGRGGTKLLSVHCTVPHCTVLLSLCTLPLLNNALYRYTMPFIVRQYSTYRTNYNQPLPPNQPQLHQPHPNSL